MIQIKQLIEEDDDFNSFNGKWYIVKRLNDFPLYLWPNGNWRIFCYQNDNNHAYYNTKEEAEATLERYKGK